MVVLHRMFVILCLFFLMACETESQPQGLYEGITAESNEDPGIQPHAAAPSGNDADTSETVPIIESEPEVDDRQPESPDPETPQAPPCSECLDGADSCETMCQESGYEGGNCQYPDSADPTECCECTDPILPPDGGENVPFDLENVVWLHTDVSDWDVTSTVTSAHINYNELCVYHTMAGQWPEIYGIFPEAPEDPMEGNIWIVAKIDDVWYAATFDYLRPGDQCKFDGYAPEDEGPGPSTFGAVPLSSWAPQPGEMVYLFMSTVARHEPMGPVNERSNLVPLFWP